MLKLSGFDIPCHGFGAFEKRSGLNEFERFSYRIRLAKAQCRPQFEGIFSIQYNSAIHNICTLMFIITKYYLGLNAIFFTRKKC